MQCIFARKRLTLPREKPSCVVRSCLLSIETSNVAVSQPLERNNTDISAVPRQRSNKLRVGNLPNFSKSATTAEIKSGWLAASHHAAGKNPLRSSGFIGPGDVKHNLLVLRPAPRTNGGGMDGTTPIHATSTSSSGSVTATN